MRPKEPLGKEGFVKPYVVCVRALILPGGQAVISATGEKKKKCSECQCQKQASFLPFQLFSLSSRVLTMLQNDAAQGKHEATEYKLSKAIIQNYFCVTYGVPPAREPLYLWHIRCTARRGGDTFEKTHLLDEE